MGNITMVGVLKGSNDLASTQTVEKQLAALNWPVDEPSEGAVRARKSRERRKAARGSASGVTAAELERRSQWSHQDVAAFDKEKVNANLGGEVHTSPAVEDFQSAPDAVDMAPSDIANVEFLEPELEIAALKTAALASEQWGDWLDDDGRWELTPHEVRKLNESKSPLRIADRFRM